MCSSKQIHRPEEFPEGSAIALRHCARDLYALSTRSVTRLFSNSDGSIVYLRRRSYEFSSAAGTSVEPAREWDNRRITLRFCARVGRARIKGQFAWRLYACSANRWETGMLFSKRTEWMFRLILPEIRACSNYTLGRMRELAIVSARCRQSAPSSERVKQLDLQVSFRA